MEAVGFHISCRMSGLASSSLEQHAYAHLMEATSTAACLAEPADTAEEYLRRVRYEAQRCPNVVRVEIDPLKLAQSSKQQPVSKRQRSGHQGSGMQPSEADGASEASTSGRAAEHSAWAEPNLRWAKQFLSDFQRLRIQLVHFKEATGGLRAAASASCLCMRVHAVACACLLCACSAMRLPCCVQSMQLPACLHMLLPSCMHPMLACTCIGLGTCQHVELSVHVHVGPASVPHNLPPSSNRKAWQDLLSQPFEGRVSYREDTQPSPPPPPPPPPPQPACSGGADADAEDAEAAAEQAEAPSSPRAAHAAAASGQQPAAHEEAGAEAARAPLAEALRPYLHAVLALDQARREGVGRKERRGDGGGGA